MNINDKGEIKEGKTGFLHIAEKLRQYLVDNYIPVTDPTEPDVIHFSSSEIYFQLQKVVPSDYYGIDDVAQWLDGGGFLFYDYGDLRFEWMMKKR